MTPIAAVPWRRVSWRRVASRALSTLVVLLCGFILGAQSANAVEAPVAIIFNDLTDSLSVTASGGDRPGSSGACFSLPEACIVTLNGPTGYSFFASTLGATGFLIAEPPGTFVSDELDPLTGFVAGSTTVSFKFLSDSEVGLGLCPVGGCDIIENGTTQLAFSIRWKTGTGATCTPSTCIQDDIFFRSDVEAAVPEPSSLMLLLGGLVGAAAPVCRRRHALNRSPSLAS